jgi:hypothetical protein
MRTLSGQLPAGRHAKIFFTELGRLPGRHSRLSGTGDAGRPSVGVSSLTVLTVNGFDGTGSRHRADRRGGHARTDCGVLNQLISACPEDNVECSMSDTEWNPACSFCGAMLPVELVRAGGRDYWICSRCIDQPTIEDRVAADAVCTFCEEPIAGCPTSLRSVSRKVVAARHGAVLCSDCIDVCTHLIAEGRARRVRHSGR